MFTTKRGEDSLLYSVGSGIVPNMPRLRGRMLEDRQPHMVLVRYSAKELTRCLLALVCSAGTLRAETVDEPQSNVSLVFRGVWVFTDVAQVSMCVCGAKAALRHARCDAPYVLDIAIRNP